MRKLFTFLVLGLLFSGNANAECIKGDCKEGYGEEIIDNGKYSGNFLKGKRSGKGTYTWNNGDQHIGGWHKNQRWGNGFMKRGATGNTEEGFWYKNKKRGAFIIVENKVTYDSVYSKKGKLISKVERVKPVTQDEIIKKYLSNRKLEKLEGVFITDAGRVMAVYKNKGKFYNVVISSSELKSGTSWIKDMSLSAKNIIRGTDACTYRIDGYQKKIKCNIVVIGKDYGLEASGTYPKWLQRDSGGVLIDYSISLSRIYPDNLITHNKKFRSKEDIDKEQEDITYIVNDVKKTCTVLGFKTGSEKFADCTLKLYTQKIDAQIAAKQEASSKNKMINTNTTQPSRSTVTTINDPVRDRQNQIDRGMKMLGGGCTLGINC